MTYIKFWREDKLPLYEDLRRTLAVTLGLLAESLPVAIAHIGKEDFKIQWSVWMAVNRFDDETDAIADSDDLAQLGGLLADWSELVRGYEVKDATCQTPNS